MTSQQFKKGKGLEEYEKIRFYHFRDLGCYSHQFNGVTVAVIVPVKSEVCLGVATCSSDDQFNKKLGRVISQGRAEKGLFSGHIESVPLVLDTDNEDDMYNLAYDHAFTVLKQLSATKCLRAGV